MDDYRKFNRAWWNEVATLHVESPFYKTDAFRRGENVLDPIARERIGEVAGRRVLHLQCHFGLDTLSIARMGAEVTGLDFSPTAIAAARALSMETGVPAFSSKRTYWTRRPILRASISSSPPGARSAGSRES